VPRIGRAEDMGNACLVCVAVVMMIAVVVVLFFAATTTSATIAVAIVLLVPLVLLVHIAFSRIWSPMRQTPSPRTGMGWAERHRAVRETRNLTPHYPGVTPYQ
jgi:ABC-type multidrug transport system fused ATPase/permease subunit